MRDLNGPYILEAHTGRPTPHREAPLSEDFPYKTTPYPYQDEVFRATRDHYTWALFLEPRLGKTKIILDTAAYLYLQGKINTLLVVALLPGLHRQWVEDEAPEHLAVPWDGMFWRNNAPVSRDERLTQLLHTTDKLVVVTWYAQSINTDAAVDWLQEFLERRQCLFVVDESAMLAHPKAKWTRRLQRLSKLTLWKRILDGHPEAESPFDYYGQMRFLSERILGYKTFTEFKTAFGNFRTFRVGTTTDLETGQKVGGREVKTLIENNPYQDLDILYKRMDIRATRLRRSDVAPQLPRHQYGVRRFELSQVQSDYYAQMRDQYMIELHNAEGTPVYGELVITRRLRLHQIACGYVPVDGEPFELVDPTENPRLQALQLELAQTTGQAMIWCRYVHDAELLMQLLGRPAVRYTGTEEQRATAKRRFMGGEAQWFIANPATAGIGLTFKGVQTMIFYSNHESGRLRFQAEERTVHMQQTQSVYICDVLAAGTIDEKIVKGLQRKYERSQQAPSSEVVYGGETVQG